MRRDRQGLMHRYVAGGLCIVFLAVGCGSCSKETTDGSDPKVTTLGSIELTARLAEVIPYDEKCVFPPNDLYDYVYIFKYNVLETHRGKVEGDTILVGQYNPLKPRAKAADARAPEIGGNVTRFQAGDIHRLALEAPLDESYMGPIINKYHNQTKATLYWAVWTNRVVR
jgi:hypothetical protein